MIDLSPLIPHLSALQWAAAVLFVPLVTWQFCLRQTIVCRWCALLSGYGVQVGFFLMMDDVGFSTEFLLLVASIAAYFWITTTVAIWPPGQAATVSPAEPDDESARAAAA